MGERARLLVRFAGVPPGMMLYFDDSTSIRLTYGPFRNAYET